MKRRVYALSVVVGLAVGGSLLAGGRRPDLYALVRDGAQEVLSATFSVSAAVLNWLEERCTGA